MALLEIELRIDQNQSPFFVLNSRMSGRTYDLRFKWSTRWLAWYLDIDSTIFGIKIVNGVDLFAPYHYNDNIPPGKLGVVRNKGTDSKPYFDNFGIEKEMTLLYIEP